MRELFPEDEKLLRWLDMADEKLRSKAYHLVSLGWVMATVQKWA